MSSTTRHRPGTEGEVPLFRGGGQGGLSDPDLLGPRMRRRRALTLVLMTLVVPGSAQLVAGNRRLGRLGLRIWLAALGGLLLLGLLALLRRSLLLTLFSRSWVLLVLAALLAVAALLWAVLFLDAARLARLGSTPPKSRALIGGLVAVLLLVTSGSLGFAASSVLAGRSAVLDLFGSNISKPATDGRYNVLLLGGDSGTERVGTRPDTIMLASVDADSGRTVLFGFARDTENINFRPGSVMHRLMPEGWNCGDQCLLNGLYTWAAEHRDQFPADVKDPGALATKEAVEALSGLTVHYYVLVDLRGFQRLVDAVGGIDVNVGRRTPIGGGTSRISGYIEPGRQHLDGYHALWYARSRQGSSNDERMIRQRCVLDAMSRQLNPQTVILKFKDIAAISGSVLRTDLPESDLGAFADLALKSRGHKLTSVNFTRPLIQPWDYDPQVILDTVRRTIDNASTDSAADGSAADSRADSTSPSTSRRATTAQTPRTRSTLAPGEVCSPA